MTNTVTHIHSDDRSELLSGYLDDALDLAARQEAKRTLQNCPACVADLAELRSLQTLLRALPAPMPRRSFTIDPATVRPRRLLSPIFRFASLAAALMLFVVLGIDALPSSDGQPASLMQDNSALKQAPAAGGAAESMPAPPENAQAQSEAATEAPAAAFSEPAMETTAVAEAADEPMESMDAPEEAEALVPALPQATAAAAEAFVPALPQATAAAGGDVGNAPDALRRSDSAAAETEELATAPPESLAPPLNIWRMVAGVLALFVVGLGGAWWWTARRGL